MDKVYTPEVLEDSNFPTEETISTSTVASSGVYTPTEIEDTSLPVKKIANELISSVLNTQSHKILGELQFTRMGAIQIGSYEEDETGDVRISPEGIVGRNTQGETTFALDGETGDATFKGTVRAGSLVSGDLVLGGKNNSDGTLTIADSDGNIIILADKLGHHYYNTEGDEQVKVDVLGLHNYNALGTEQIRIDFTGFHAYGSVGTSNELVRVDNDGLHGYLLSGVESLNVGPNGINGYGSTGNTFEFYNEVGGTLHGKIGYYLDGTSPYFKFEGVNGAGFLIKDQHNVLGLAASGGMLQVSDGLISITAGGQLTLKGADSGGVDSGGIYFYNYDLGNYVEKMAIIPTSKGYNALYCTESPEIWFMDFYKDKVDPLFIEVTESPYHEIECKDGFTQIWGKRKGLKNKRFGEKTQEEFIRNNQFWSQSKVNYQSKIDNLKTLKKVV
jgi:hypothetical protein